MTILAMGFWFHPLYWILVRFLAGVGVGALFVAIESWFLLASAPSMRSQALSVYLIVLYGALSFGQLLIGIVNLKGCFPFLLGAGLCTLALLPIVFVKTSPPLPQHPAPYTLLQSFRSSPRGFFGGVVSGIVLACVYGLGPAFGQQIGLAAADTGTFMAALIFGGLSLQWPLGKWADCSSRKRVLLFASLCSALFSLLIALFASASWPLLLALAWLFGGAAYVIYPLSMAFTCEALEECQIVAATGGFVLSYGIGAVAGPLAAPPFMAWLGPQGLFYFIAAVCLLLALISIPSRKR
jgi:MFS family permease